MICPFGVVPKLSLIRIKSNAAVYRPLFDLVTTLTSISDFAGIGIGVAKSY